MSTLLLLAACARRPPQGMVVVPAGLFYMGLPLPAPGAGPVSDGHFDPNGPKRGAELTWLPTFFLDRTEVTQAQYAEFVRATGYRPPYVDEDWATKLGFNWEGGEPPPNRLDHPVVLASWYDAREYCAWRGKRLPTEAEWEKACYGTDGRVFPWGWTFDQARLNDGDLNGDPTDASDGWLYTSPVGSFPGGASPYGALDMFGNAWEWTADHPAQSWDETREPPIPFVHVSPRGPRQGIYRQVRGASYYLDISFTPWMERNPFLPEIRRKTSGFRCALDP